MWSATRRYSAPRRGWIPIVSPALAFALAGATVQAQPTPLQPGQKLWEFQTGGSLTAPAVASDGTVYFGSADKKVYALDGKTGNKQWEFQADAAIGASPVIGPDGTVYIMAGGTVYALHGATGNKKSQFTPLGGFQALAVGADGILFLTSWAGGVTAVDSTTGTVKWKAGGDSCCGNSYAPVLAFGHTTYVVRNGYVPAAPALAGSVRAFDSVTGELRWQSSLGSYPGPPALGGAGAIYLGNGDVWQTGFFAPRPSYWLAALDGLTGRERWRFSEACSSAPVVGPDETVYCSNLKKIYALDGNRGALKWQRADSSVVGSPVLAADGTLYVPHGSPPTLVGSEEGVVLALDSATGELKWKFETGQRISLSAISLGSDGGIYFGGTDGKAYALKGSAGLAPGPWPKFQQNAQNTGLLQLPTPPTLLTQPTNQAVLVGTGVKLEALAAGALPLQYQWRKDDQPMLGATNHFLLLPAVKLSDTGKYSMAVSNAFGSVTSTGAVLTVGYSLTTSIRGKGSVRRNPDLAVYPPGTRAELLATPGAGRSFVRWDGALVEKANPVTVTVETNLEMVAIFDARPGEELWRSSLKFSGLFVGGFCPAIGTDGTVYVTDAGALYALNGLSGTQKWEFAGVGQPVIGPDGMVYVGTGGGLYALDGRTGARKWEFLKGGWATTPALGADGAVYFGSREQPSGGKVYSLDVATGRKNWEFLTEEGVSLAPAVGADGTVYVASGKYVEAGEKVYALDGATGLKKWEILSGKAFDTSFAVGGDGTVYIAASGRLEALEGSTGKSKWGFGIGSNYFGFTSSVVGPDNTVFTGYVSSPTFKGSLVALEGATGKKKWSSFQLDRQVNSTPALGSDGTLYFCSDDGKLYALETTTGSKKWELPLLDARLSNRFSPLAIGADGTLYFTASASSPQLSFPVSNYVFAVQASSGLALSPWPKFQQDAQNSGRLKISGPPTILNQPSKASAVFGSTVTLGVGASGALPLQYQWRKDDQPIVGATNGTLALPAVTLSDSGNYSVVITNSAGSATSAPAAVTVGYSLATRSIGNGTVKRSPDLVVYPPDSRVELLAVSEMGRQLKRWEGALAGQANPATLTIQTNLEVTAVFEARPGDALWRFANPDSSGVLSTPAIGSDGTVYVGTYPMSRVLETVYLGCLALDGLTGIPKWEFRAAGGIDTTPVLGPDGTVFVGSGGRKLYALDGATGAVRREFLMDRWDAGIIVRSLGLGASGTIYVGAQGFDNKLYAIDSTTGNKKWELVTELTGVSSATVGSDETIYSPYDHIFNGAKLFALEGATGKKKWEYHFGEKVGMPLALGREGTVFVASWVHPDASVKFYALDGTTGTEKWEVALKGEGYIFAVVGSDDSVFAGTSATLYALEGDSGKTKWSFEVNLSGFMAAPALGADGTLYVGSTEGKLYALEAATGVKKWELQTNIPIRSPLALGADSVLYFVAGSYVFAVQASSGLAPGPWPKFQQNARNTGSIQDYFKSLPRFNRTLTRFTRDGFSLSVEGGIGQPHLIEWTSDWRVWTPLQQFTNALGRASILDRGATNSPYRFYRARSQTGN